ncbi:MAG TPA: hypothetical protein VGD78_05775 [Chthoniobacterales bacterium]
MKIKRLFAVGITVAALAACSTPTDEVGTFYRRNPAAVGGGATKATASYILCAPGMVPTTAQAYVRNGYRFLGGSDFANLTAEPMRAQALAQAQQIGANLILYSVQPLGLEVHPVTKTVMESQGRYVTSTTVQQNQNPTPSPYGVNTDVTSPDFLKPVDSPAPGNSPNQTATTTTYVPPKYREQVVPETFTRTQHSIAFLAR